jgi:hypothetical protein
VDSTCDAGRTFVLAAWLGAAAIVTLVRFLNATPLGYDPSWQIQAAQNLLAGKGLSIYTPTTLDLAQPATLTTLTHWPCGLSLVTAALLAMGLSVATVIKLLGATATMLGWWGWARFSYPFVAEGWRRRHLWRWAALAIAVSLPLGFTLTWAGTDILVWAAVPWVLGWLTARSEGSQDRGLNPLDVAAGAVCGLCVLMRYAGLFLAVYAAAVILWQCRSQTALLARRWLSFGSGLGPALALQLYVNHVLSNTPAAPGGLRFGRGLGFAIRRAWDGLWSLGTSSCPWIFWLPGGAVDFIARPDESIPWRAAIVSAILTLCVLCLVRRGLAAAASDPGMVGLALCVGLPFLLWACMTLATYDFLADPRHHVWVVPFSLLLVYAAATAQIAGTRIDRIFQSAASIHVIGYIAISLVGIALRDRARVHAR